MSSICLFFITETGRLNMQIRVGIHTGPVSAGVIGTKMVCLLLSNVVCFVQVYAALYACVYSLSVRVLCLCISL